MIKYVHKASGIFFPLLYFPIIESKETIIFRIKEDRFVSFAVSLKKHGAEEDFFSPSVFLLP